MDSLNDIEYRLFKSTLIDDTIVTEFTHRINNIASVCESLKYLKSDNFIKIMNLCKEMKIWNNISHYNIIVGCYNQSIKYENFSKWY